MQDFCSKIKAKYYMHKHDFFFVNDIFQWLTSSFIALSHYLKYFLLKNLDVPIYHATCKGILFFIDSSDSLMVSRFSFLSNFRFAYLEKLRRKIELCFSTISCEKWWVVQWNMCLYRWRVRKQNKIICITHMFYDSLPRLSVWYLSTFLI